MTKIGTSFFQSMRSALAYYANCGTDAAEVKRKVADREITIGTPPPVKGASIILTDDGARYAYIFEDEIRQKPRVGRRGWKRLAAASKKDLA